MRILKVFICSLALTACSKTDDTSDSKAEMQITNPTSSILFACETGIDQMNKGAIEKFSLGKDKSFHQFILDDTNQVWMFCGLNNGKLGCTIGRLPDGISEAARNYMNLIPAAQVNVEASTNSLFLSTGSYSVLAGQGLVNYNPYITCRQE